MSDYLVGKFVPSWGEGIAKTITFIVTEDCNLRCKYCYILNKSSNKKMTFDVAKKQIDQFLNNDHVPEMVIVDFIGGEPLLEIDLIDKICDYFKIKSFQLDKPCWWNYRFNIGTNGTMYLVDRVQKFLKKKPGEGVSGNYIGWNKRKA